MPRPDSLPIRVLLTALVAFGPLSTDLYLPSLPTLVRVFDTDVVTVQMTLSIFLIGFAVSQLIYGPMSDRFGRRPTLLVGW
ncbi:MFS transporter [Azospirillum sp. INR13]|uniref:MFS transporter n=1 Tax=Azospirillum sp. INR13 TaxID=2596919 RepID=UPI0021042882|nr:MFS transporter [Azospirillum sp. INR13]